MATQNPAASNKRVCDAMRNAVRNEIRPLKITRTIPKDFQAKLLDNDKAMDSTLAHIKGGSLLEDGDYFRKILDEFPELNEAQLVDSHQISVICQKIHGFQVDKDKFWTSLIDIGVIMNGSEDVLKHYKSAGFCENAVECTYHPGDIVHQMALSGTTNAEKQGKIPRYTAFSGASGSGKTNTMLWTVHNPKIFEDYLSPGQMCLRYYISCNAPEEQTLFQYVKDHFTTTVNTRLGPIFALQDFTDQCKATVLVLILDEVQSRWDHKTYFALPGSLEETFKFARVILLVGSTAISQDVCRQPNADGEVLNIRMKPLPEETMPSLLIHHLPRANPRIKQPDELVRKLFVEMPLLSDLMANHRCAALTAFVLGELLGKIPMKEIPDGWGQGNSAALLSMVACKYRALNRLGSRLPEDCRRIMLQSLALLASQKVVEPHEGIDKNPEEDSLFVLAKELVEVGLVERAIMPDEKLPDIEKVRVDGLYEFQMSPALTLICITSIAPWIEGIHNAADHFEALVATLVVAMRYAQTNKLYDICRMSQAVPYNGNEKHKYYEPSIPIDDKCFINGPQAPYSDLILAGVPAGYRVPESAGKLAVALSNQPGAVEFPEGPLLVQCKMTSKETAKCFFNDEFAKMGLTAPPGPGGLCSPVENPHSQDTKQHWQYQSGSWLTKNWVTSKKGTGVKVAFSTNKCFDSVDGKDDLFLMEADGNYENAWQKLYPINELVRNASHGSASIERKSCDPNNSQ